MGQTQVIKEVIVSTSKAGNLSYRFPIRGTYREAGREIINSGGMVPVGDYAAPLVHAIYTTDGKDFSEARKYFNHDGLVMWVYGQNLWTPEGLFVLEDRMANGFSPMPNVETLKQKLVGGKSHRDIQFSSDGMVRFAPKESYNIDIMDVERLAADGVVIAQYGVEGAKLLADAALRLCKDPASFGETVKDGERPVQTIPSLDVHNGRLNLDSCDYDARAGFSCSMNFAS